jgi:hypothetical protein
VSQLKSAKQSEQQHANCGRIQHGVGQHLIGYQRSVMISRPSAERRDNQSDARCEEGTDPQAGAFRQWSINQGSFTY